MLLISFSFFAISGVLFCIQKRYDISIALNDHINAHVEQTPSLYDFTLSASAVTTNFIEKRNINFRAVARVCVSVRAACCNVHFYFVLSILTLHVSLRSLSYGVYAPTLYAFT